MSDTRPAPECPFESHGPMKLIYTDKPRDKKHLCEGGPDQVIDLYHCSQCSCEIHRPHQPITPA